MSDKNEENKNIIEINESSLDPKDEKNQLRYTQKEAYDDLSKSLSEALLEKRRKQFNRKHNTIFVNGKRGSGKTQFLLSIKKFMKKENKKFKKLYFFKPIDPTLLHDNENFLTIILAMILNDLNKKSKLKNLSSMKQAEFYDLLNKLSQAIDGTINNQNQDRSSLENIAQDQSSLQLEQYINDFFYLVLEISNKQKLVILIDDIDMALDKGFEVLEVIRKYLSSSHVIPIVTGDIDLYTPLVDNHFLSSLPSIKNNLYPSYQYHYTQNKTRDGVINNLLDTSIDYLIKVFPMHHRIKIKTFWELAEKKLIRFEFKNEVRTFKRRNTEVDIECNISFDSSIEDFKSEVIKNLFNLPARSIIQIFKKELTQDNAEKFLTTFQSIEKIYTDYHYNILPKVTIINTYKELIDKDITTKDYEKA